MRASLALGKLSTFTAAIRWLGPDKAVQIETRHPGFEDLEVATSFAAGICNDSPKNLRLNNTDAVMLLLGDGRQVDYPYDLVIAWISPTCGGRGFQSHRLSSLADHPDANGEYRRAGYAVLGSDGTPIRTVIDFDNADRIAISIEDGRIPISDPRGRKPN
jgi:hypothetical protein